LTYDLEVQNRGGERYFEISVKSRKFLHIGISESIVKSLFHFLNYIVYFFADYSYILVLEVVEVHVRAKFYHVQFMSYRVHKLFALSRNGGKSENPVL